LEPRQQETIGVGWELTKGGPGRRTRAWEWSLGETKRGGNCKR